MVIVWIMIFLFAFYGLTKLMDPEPSQIHISEEDEKLQKGYSFEQQITQIVSEKLKGAIVINNCILNKKSKSGKDIYFDGTVASKEIDVIILSKKGFFVVEAKNFSQAFVSGNLNYKTWLTSYSKKKVYKCQFLIGTVKPLYLSVAKLSILLLFFQFNSFFFIKSVDHFLFLSMKSL